MAYYLFTYVALFSLMSTFCHSFNPKLLNVSKSYYDSSWLTTGATWYGAATGSGSDGGSCGFQGAVASAPFNSLISAVSASLYSNGAACGKCFEVKCTSSELCSGDSVTVVVTDSCLGCDHGFDLSGTSFGAMTNQGDENKLRNVGTLQIQYKSVECKFPGVNIAFRVDPGSNPNYFAAAIEFENQDGITEVHLKKTNTDDWLPMSVSWGSIWKADLITNDYLPPFSIKLTNSDSQTVVAEGVIPAHYELNAIYSSHVNFDG